MIKTDTFNTIIMWYKLNQRSGYFTFDTWSSGDLIMVLHENKNAQNYIKKYS